MKKKRECNIETCPMFVGLFLEGQKMSGQAKEAINKKLIKWFKMRKRLNFLPKSLVLTRWVHKDWKSTIKTYGLEMWIRHYTSKKKMGECDVTRELGEIKVRITIEQIK